MYKFNLGEKVFAFNKKEIYNVISITLTRNNDKDQITYTLYDKLNNQMLENVPEFYIRSTRKLENLTKDELIDLIIFYHNYKDKNSINDIELLLNTDWLEYNRNKNNRLSDQESEILKKIMEE